MKNSDVNTTRTHRPQVLVYGYLCINLGDDLLFRILVERYPEVDFYIFTGVDYEPILGRENLHLIRRNRINRIFAHHLPYQLWLRKFDAMVYIGGSIFMERGQSGMCSTTRNLQKIHKAFPCLPIHIIGCNYGPEQTPAFRREVESVFEFVESVCVRDRYSYNLFAPTNSRISYAPDVVFNLCPPSEKVGVEQAVVFSVIDLATRPSLAHHTAHYEDMMAQLIENHLQRGERVKLLSFCTAEGDVVACERIVERLKEQSRALVEVVAYEGDIDHALATLRSASVLYATRFHATILGALFGVPTVPIVYSDKTQHVLDDMGWSGNTLDLRQPRHDFATLCPHTLDGDTLDTLRTEARNQFTSLDKTLSICRAE